MKARNGMFRTGRSDGSRAITLRRAAVASTAAMAVLLGWVSLSWACGLYTPAPMAAVTPDRATAAAPLTVSGTGWQADGPVAVSLSTDGTNVVQSLGTPATAPDGTFSLSVHLGDAAAGVYYVTVTQGAVHSNAPLEITGQAFSAANRWPGLAPGSKAPSITDAGHAPSGSAFPWAPVLVAGGVLACCALLGAAELRRQRAAS